MLEAIAIGVFVFVALSVGGWRALDAIAASRAPVDRKPQVTPYTGPRYTVHGREIVAEVTSRRIV